ncbi:MAG: sugar kinase [Ilumatobacteraceae bacterium]
MTGPRLVTCGEAMIRLSTPTGHLLRNTPVLNVHVGGSELNAAIVAAQLGVDACWISSLPEGPLGERIVDHARTFGVEVVAASSNDRVGLYFVEIGPAPRDSEVYYDRQRSSFSTSTADQLVELALEHPTDAVLASGITLALGGGPARFATRLLERTGTLVRFFEVNHRSKLWGAAEARPAIEKVLPNVDILIASAHDLSGLLDLGDDIVVAARRAQERWGIQTVVVSGRSGGVGEVGVNEITVIAGDVVAAASAQGLVIDPVGAGDASTGAYIATWLRTGSHQASAEQAARAAALKQTCVGDALVLDVGSLDGAVRPRIRR